LTDWEVSQDYQRQHVAYLQPGQPVGQTFTTRRQNLDKIQVFTGAVNAEQDSEVNLRASLYYTPDDLEPFLTQDIGSIRSSPIEISIPSHDPPQNGNYFLLLEIDGGSVTILGRSENTYPGGQAYSGFIPLDADLAFRTTYRYNLQHFTQDVSTAAGGIWLVIPLSVLLLAPGWLLLDITGLRKNFDGGEQVALSIALSLGLLPLLMMWTSIFDMNWTQFNTTAAGVLLIGAVLWQILRRPIHLKITWPGAALIFIFIISLSVRLIMVRDLAAPAWVDSIHHALIANIIQEHGGFPASYEPYLSIDATQYHPGFHTGLAVFAWFSRLDMSSSLLIYGQVLNAFAVLAAYLLTTTLTGDRWAGVIAALITGLITPMPAYFVSWGRYTHLAGLLILPAAPALVRSLLDKEEISPRRNLLLAVIAVSGLILVHYRVAAFLALLLVAMVISRITFQRQPLKKLFRQSGIVAGYFSAGALLLTGPWLLPTLSRHILPVITPGQTTSTEPFADFSWGLLTTGFGIYSLWLAGLGLLLGIILRRRFILAVVMWTLFLLLLANLNALSLPGSWFINNTSVQISLFLPISLLSGFFLSTIIRFPPPLISYPIVIGIRGFFIIGLFIFGLLGMRGLITIINPNTVLVREPDLVAMQWIREYIPMEETILINSFNWGYGVYAGSDGGFWISPFTGRKTMPPAVLYGFERADSREEITNLSRQTIEYGNNPSRLWDVMQDHDLQYVYIGVRGGALSSNALFESPLFNLVYSTNGVSIFKTVNSKQADI
jgi:hypothetical protein